MTEIAEEPILPTKSEWDESAHLMAETMQQRRDLIDVVRRRIVAWWEDQKFALRTRLRAWLGVDTIEDQGATAVTLLVQCGTDLGDHELLIEGLRADLDANAAVHLAAAKLFDERLTLNTQNEAEIIRQLHQGLRQVESHAKVVKVLMQNVLFRKQWKAYLEAEQKAERARQIRAVAKTNGTPIKGDVMAQAGAALRGGEESPGDGWEPLACSTCGKVCGWFDPSQNAVKKPDEVRCAEHAAKPEPVRETEPRDTEARHTALLAETQRNFDRAMFGQEELFELDPMPDGEPGEPVAMFQGVPMSDVEKQLVKSERRRLLDEQRKPESD